MSAKFLLQLLCILIACRCVGWIGRKYLGPTLVALLISPLLLSTSGLFAVSATQLQATLFMIAAIAITAFLMLVRITHENGLSNTGWGLCRCLRAPLTMRLPGTFLR